MRWAQEQRLRFIRERLARQGYVNRRDLMEEFAISQAQASIDFRTLREYDPSVLKYNPRAKRYEPL